MNNKRKKKLITSNNKIKVTNKLVIYLPYSHQRTETYEYLRRAKGDWGPWWYIFDTILMCNICIQDKEKKLYHYYCGYHFDETYIDNTIKGTHKSILAKSKFFGYFKHNVTFYK